jgi:plasmid maintenance system antidote protein VapI
MNFALLKAIKEERLTQREFARLVGDHESVVSRVINEIWVIDEMRKIRYSKVLRRKPEELFPMRHKR